jgi:hypothetical protein
MNFKNYYEANLVVLGDQKISENLRYHIDNNITLSDSVFRTYSESYFSLIEEAKSLYKNNLLEVCDEDADLLESDLGETAECEGQTVYLDAPFLEDKEINEAEYQGKNVTTGKPFRTPGEKKKFAVYVRSSSGKIKKVRFGDPNMKIRASNPARRKSFAARHKCSEKTDRTTPGYWSCRSHRMKSLGTKDKGKYW